MVTFQGSVNITDKYALEFIYLKQSKYTCNFSFYREAEARKIVRWTLKLVL